MSGQMVKSIEGLRYVLLVVSKMESFLEILGKIHWEWYLMQLVDFREGPPVGCQMVMLVEEDCLVEDWESLLGLCFGYII